MWVITRSKGAELWRLPHLAPLSFGAVFLILLAGGISTAASPILDDFVVLPSTVLPGGVVSLTLQAHDPDCPDVCTSGCGQYIRSDLTNWSTTGGTFISIDNGASGSPYTTTAEWQAPEAEGVYTISVYVADSGSFVCGGRQSFVPSIDIQVTTSTNAAPVVQLLTADPVLLFPGAESSLTCLATDPDGDALTYSWQSDLGTVTPEGQGLAVFQAGPDPGAPVVSCTATDVGGLFGSGTVTLSVIGAQAEKSIHVLPASPQRLAVDSMGGLYVVDARGGGIIVIHLDDEETLYRIPLTGVTSVDVDWDDNLLVGGRFGARLCDRKGDTLLTLEEPGTAGDPSDVAVDRLNRRYGVLHRGSGRIHVYDDLGATVAAFGSVGDAQDQLKSPLGLAASPAGEWVVADSSHGLIKVFDSSGAFVRSFGGLGGGAGEFVQLTDVAVDTRGVIFASDTFQSWVQSFNPDGTLRETLGTHGTGLGELTTPTGIAPVERGALLLVASSNGSTVEVFRTSNDPPADPLHPLGETVPSALTFAPLAVGAFSPAQQIQLNNLGQAPLALHGITASPDFNVSNDCGPFVDPGMACTLEVLFVPTVPGSLSGSIFVDTSASDTPLAVALDGVGLAPPRVVLNPAAWTFGDRIVGSISDPTPIVLINAGGSPLEIQSIDTSPHFSRTSDCGPSVAPGGSCTVEVRFAPLAEGNPVTGGLTVTSNSPNGADRADLSGRAVLYPDLVIEDWSGSEGDPAGAEFRVRPSLPPIEMLSVEYATIPDTAEGIEDFEPVQGTLTLAPGQTSASIVVGLVEDGLLEPDEESFAIELSNPVAVRIARPSATGTIQDDELCESPNLLTNAGAESPPSGGAIPGWVSVGGEWQLREDSPLPLEGQRYFSAADVEVAELVQVVDVTPFLRQLTLDEQSFVFEVWVRSGDEAPADSARVRVEYLHRETGVELDAFDSDEVSDVGAWQRIADVRSAPPETGSIRIRLIGARYSGTTNDAYFDAVSLRSIRTPTVSVDAVTTYEGDSDPSTIEFALQLSCPYWQPVTLNYATRDGGAVAGEDYRSAEGSTTLPARSTSTRIAIEILGDDLDEDDESFFLGLTPGEPTDIAILNPLTEAIILDDDFCPRSVNRWWRRSSPWTVTTLTVGGVAYDEARQRKLLGYTGSDAASGLAAELVATLLNLAEGSHPGIRPTADDANALLELFPPGSDPLDPDRKLALQLRDTLRRYNNAACPGQGGRPRDVRPGNDWDSDQHLEIQLREGG